MIKTKRTGERRMSEEIEYEWEVRDEPYQEWLLCNKDVLQQEYCEQNEDDFDEYCRQEYAKDDLAHEKK